MECTDLTNDFVAAFPDQQSCVGYYAKMIAMLGVPDGVNSEDERVKQVVYWCKGNMTANHGE